jgi:hypothetical protein
MLRFSRAYYAIAFFVVAGAVQLPLCSFDAITCTPASISSAAITPVQLMLKSPDASDQTCTVANVAAQGWALRFSTFRLSLSVDIQRSTPTNITFNPINVPALLNASLLHPDTNTYAMEGQLLMNGVLVVQNSALFHYYRHIILRQATIVLRSAQDVALVSLAANAFPLIPDVSPTMKLRLLLKSQVAPIDISVTHPQRVSTQRMEATLLRSGIDTIVEYRDDIINLLVMFSVDGSSYQSFAVAQPRTLFGTIKPVTPSTTASPSSSSPSSRPSSDYWLPLLPLLLALVILGIAAACQSRRVALPPTSDAPITRTNPVGRVRCLLIHIC